MEQNERRADRTLRISTVNRLRQAHRDGFAGDPGGSLKRPTSLLDGRWTPADTSVKATQSLRRRQSGDERHRGNASVGQERQGASSTGRQIRWCGTALRTGPRISGSLGLSGVTESAADVSNHARCRHGVNSGDAARWPRTTVREPRHANAATSVEAQAGLEGCTSDDSGEGLRRAQCERRRLRATELGIRSNPVSPPAWHQPGPNSQSKHKPMEGSNP